MEPRLKRSGTKLSSSYTSSGHINRQLFTVFLGWYTCYQHTDNLRSRCLLYMAGETVSVVCKFVLHNTDLGATFIAVRDSQMLLWRMSAIFGICTIFFMFILKIYVKTYSLYSLANRKPSSLREATVIDTLSFMLW